MTTDYSAGLQGRCVEGVPLLVEGNFAYEMVPFPAYFNCQGVGAAGFSLPLDKTLNFAFEMVTFTEYFN